MSIAQEIVEDLEIYVVKVNHPLHSGEVHLHYTAAFCDLCRVTLVEFIRTWKQKAPRKETETA